MSFLGRILKDAIGEGISKAVGNAVEKAAAPVAEKWANKTAAQLDEAAGKVEDAQKETGSSLENAFANLERAAENYGKTMMDASVNALWENYLAGMPKYSFQASSIEMDESGTTQEGGQIYWVTVRNTTDEAFESYVALLKESGYVGVYPGSDETMYKQCDGYVLGFNQTDAKENEEAYTFQVWRASSKENLY